MAPPGRDEALPWLAGKLAVVRWLYFNSEEGLQEQSNSSLLGTERMQKQPDATPCRLVPTSGVLGRHDVV